MGRFQLSIILAATLRRAVVALALLGPLGSASLLLGQLPTTRLTNLMPSGGKVGSEFAAVATGEDFDEVDRLVFSHPGITATQKIEPPHDYQKVARPVFGEFTIKIGGDVPPGMYEVRAAGRYGLSNPRIFQVTNLNEVAKPAANNSPASAIELSPGSAAGGQLNNESVDYYKLKLAKDQRVLCECFAQRIDAKMDATLTLYDAAGRELLKVRDTIGLDPVLDFKAPDDGEYLLAVYDFTYTGGPEYFYRLLAHSNPVVSFVFPPVGQPGTTSKFKLFGRNLPGSTPAEGMRIGGVPLDVVEVDVAVPSDPAAGQSLEVKSLLLPHQGHLDAYSYRWESPQGAANAVQIGFAKAPIVLEVEPNDDPAKPQQVNVPCEIAGNFYPQADSDWIQFDAKKDEVLWIEVISHRMGKETDPLLVIERLNKKENGELEVQQIAVEDDLARRDNQPQPFDMRTRDASYRLAVSQDSTYRVQVKDLYGEARTLPGQSYRLVIRPSQPDFRAVAFANPLTNPANNNQVEIGSLVLRRGGSDTLNVRVQRVDGFDGEIHLSVEGLPAGVSCAGATIGGSVDTASLVLFADDNAPAGMGNFKVLAKANVNGQELTREVRGGAVIWGTRNLQQDLPWGRLSPSFSISVIDKETSPATVKAGDGNLVETSVGGKVEIPISIARRNGFGEQVKLKAQGVPGEFQPREIDIATDGKYELVLSNQNVRPGTYTFSLVGQAKIKYDRNQDAVKLAQEMQKEIEEILKSFSDQLPGLQEEARKAREAANQKKDDAGLQEAAQKADQLAKDMEAKRKEAENRKRAADQKLQSVQNDNKQRDVMVELYSSPIRLKVVADPIVVQPQMPAAAVKQGEKLEVPVNVERKYGFDDQVEITFEPPGGVGGINAPKLTIPKGQNEGKLELMLAPNATPGAHSFTLRGRVRFNNVQLDDTQTVSLTIEEVKPAQ